MMDLIRMKACTTLRITYLVLDEADRMFDMGFGEQVGHQGCFLILSSPQLHVGTIGTVSAQFTVWSACCL